MTHNKIPFPRDRDFIHRESIFVQIKERVERGCCASLFGMGGVGFDSPPLYKNTC
jgi:hypothetical protein